MWEGRGRCCPWQLGPSRSFSSFAGSISDSLPPRENAGREHVVNFLVLIVSGLIGWCPPLPRPRPDPPGPRDPLAGIIGGIAGAHLVHFALGIEGALSSMDFVAISIGAFACGRVLSQVVNWVFPSRIPD